MSENVLVRCGRCGTVNSIPAGKIGMHPRCGRCKVLLSFPEAPINATMASFEDEVVRWPGAVLVEFWSQTCGICASLMPSIYDLARQRAGRLKVVLINVERELFLANRFNVLSLPTFIIYNNGRLINRLDGALARARLEEWIDASTSLSFRF
ncbi:MAG TPA: thioredoxin domain-containing protein [Dissulfurispiraceae bacterium]|nr:thioredoxin domain-containing protein [Dissulfurispiraceae bacterium]